MKLMRNLMTLAVLTGMILALGFSVQAAKKPMPEGVIDINAATAEELTQLPGIGEKKADVIVSYRTEHGRFGTVEDLMNVKGIGEKTFLKLKPYITVSATQPAPAQVADASLPSSD